MESLKFNVFSFLNKSKETTVPLVPLCPIFPYTLFLRKNCGHYFKLQLEADHTEGIRNRSFNKAFETNCFRPIS